MAAFPTEWVVAGVIQLAVAWALAAWGGWVARRKGGGAWRYIAWLPWLAFGLGILGTATAIKLLTQSFDSVSTVEASQKSRLLAAGISRAMHVAVPLMLSSTAIYLTSLVINIAGTAQRPAER